MKKIIVFLFLLAANNLLAAAERAEEELIHPGARGSAMAKDLIDLRNFPEFYGSLVGHGTTAEITEQQLDLRRHPLVSIEQCFGFMEEGDRVIRLARNFFELHEFDVIPSLRGAVRKYQDPFNLISLVVSERRPPVSVLRCILCLAKQTPGVVTMEERPGYVQVARPSALPEGMGESDAAKDARGLTDLEAGRVNHLRQARLCLADTCFGPRPMGPLLDREMVGGWHSVRDSSRASVAVSERLEGAAAELFGPQKNYASLRAIVLDAGGTPVAILDPGVVASSGTMPLGVEGTGVIHHEATGMAALVSDEFPRPVIFPGSSEYLRETLEADAEVRAKVVDAGVAAAAAVEADDIGPLERLHDRRALYSLRKVCECCHTHAPVSTRAYIAKKGSGYPHTTKEDYYKLYAHSEQAFRPVIRNWLPAELSKFMRRNPRVHVGRVVLSLSTLRDACSECSMALSYLMDSTMFVRKVGIGFERMESPVMVVSGYRSYMAQFLRRANGVLRFDMKDSRSRRMGLRYDGVDLLTAAGLLTINATEPAELEEGEDPADAEDPVPLS